MKTCSIGSKVTARATRPASTILRVVMESQPPRSARQVRSLFLKQTSRPNLNALSFRATNRTAFTGNGPKGARNLLSHNCREPSWQAARTMVSLAARQASDSKPCDLAAAEKAIDDSSRCRRARLAQKSRQGLPDPHQSSCASYWRANHRGVRGR